MSSTMQDVFELLKREMAARGWNVSRLAEACGTDIALTSRWVAENPDRRVIPGPKSCAKIAAALGLETDYVLELAGHRQPRPDRPSPDPVHAELDARLDRLGTTLSRYPRAFWLAVLEAGERMAEAGEALTMVAEPPLSAPSQGGFSAAHQPKKRSRRAANGDLPAAQGALAAWFRAPALIAS